MQNKMAVITVRLDEDQQQKLKKLTDTTGLNQTDTIRYIIEEAYKKIDPDEMPLRDMLNLIYGAIRYNLIETIKIHGGKKLDQLDREKIMEHFGVIHEHLHGKAKEDA